MSDEPRIDFLEDEAPEAEVAEVEAPETPEPETVETPEPPAAEVPTTPEPKEEHVPLAALKAERAKRQEYEAKLREYEQRQQQTPPPNFYEAPQQYIEAVLSQHEQQTNQRLLNALEAQAREVYSDYDAMVGVVQERAAENPVIVQQLLSAANPAMAAYKLGKQLAEMEAMKDPDAYRKQIEAEVRAKLQAEMDAKEAARQKAASAVPPDLSNARSSKDTDEVPDDSLESILSSKR